MGELMTLQERLNRAHEESVTLYLRRQQVEAQRLQITKMGSDIDHQLVRLDAAIDLLADLLNESQKATEA